MWSFVSPTGAYVGKLQQYYPNVSELSSFADLAVLADDSPSPSQPIVTAQRAVFPLPDGYGASGLTLATYADPGYATLAPGVVYGNVVASFNASNEGTDRFVKLYIVEIVDVPPGSPYTVGQFIAVNEQRLFHEREGYAFVYHDSQFWPKPETDFVLDAFPDGAPLILPT